jgi:hypothetical protein
MTKKETMRRFDKAVKELLEMYKKSFPIFLKNWKDKEYNKAIIEFNRRQKK